MRKTMLLFVLAMLVAGGTARAQERVGAGRFDVTLAPIGGMFFTESSTKGEPPFGDFALAGALTYHFNSNLALEGELANAIGVRQEITLPDGTVLLNQRSPSVYAYTGNLVFHPRGSNHAWVPYVAGGFGGVTMLSGNSVKALGINSNETYFTENIGGGLKWFAHARWGLRGEYRLVTVTGKSTAPEFFGQDVTRYGHRVYGGLLINY